MYNAYNNYPCPNYRNMPWYNPDMVHSMRRMYSSPYPHPMYRPYYINQYANQLPYDVTSHNVRPERRPYPNNNYSIELLDYGPEPFAVDINDAAEQNNSFRNTLWTGNNLQLTLMSLNPGEDIGLEMHPDVDQFIGIEEGHGVVRMGDNEDLSDFEAYVDDDFIFIIPAGKWHNLINTGNEPLKLYSIYAPPNHPHGTVHETKEEAQAAEH